jgi:hypothetical protein
MGTGIKETEAALARVSDGNSACAKAQGSINSFSSDSVLKENDLESQTQSENGSTGKQFNFFYLKFELYWFFNTPLISFRALWLRVTKKFHTVG